MKIFLTGLIILAVLINLGGCNSGTMKGVGSDVEKLGEKMQS